MHQSITEDHQQKDSRSLVLMKTSCRLVLPPILSLLQTQMQEKIQKTF